MSAPGTLPEGRPRIVIDARMVSEVPHGFSRYVSALARGLAKVEESGSLPYEPVFLVSREAAAKEKQMRAFAGFATCEAGSSFLSPLELLELPRLIRRLNAAAYHSPTFSSLRGLSCPWLVSVHDLNHLQYGSRVQKAYYRYLLKPFVQKASVVTTVSTVSQKELAQWAGIEASTIEVVPNALDSVFLERVEPIEAEGVASKFSLEANRYFFCLSNPKPHKNLARLVSAFAKYREKAGHTAAWDLALNLAPGELELPSVPGLKLLGRLSDQDARALMAGAGAVAFPSLYEGFGLPPVEAACLGAPLIVSRIPAHREALSDLEQGEVLWVDPVDEAAWVNALQRAAVGQTVGTSIESRSRLMRRYGVARLGAQMDQLYRRVLGLKS